jgi:hAT family C-terminal dimerisation region
MFNNLMDDMPASSSGSDDELQHYLATDVEDVKDGLMWWYERCTMYPHLSHMAHNYLAIPCEYMIFLHLSKVLNP